MKLETFFVRADEQTASTASAAFLCAGLLAVTLVLTYRSTAQSIVAIWMRSDTFAHGFLIVPIFLWLLWRDRSALARQVVHPFWPAVAGVAIAGFLWLTAQLATVSSLAQFALLFMVELSAIAVLGLSIARRIAFPLLFLFLAIPFGEFLMPWLIDRTADATVALLQLSGVPVHREGNHFQIPTGRWSVVEACSGLRYLVASVAGGTIFAYLRFHSLKKRLLFVVASFLVPIVANWLRAYGIVMLGHLTNNKLGADVDHLIYGWVFFGFVMGLLFWIGSRWEDSPISPHNNAPLALNAKAVSAKLIRPILVATACCVVGGLAWQPLYARLTSLGAWPTPELEIRQGANGWQTQGLALTSWKPTLVGYSAELSEVFAKDGRPVGLYISYFRNQAQGRELIGSKNALVFAADERWTLLARHEMPRQVGGHTIRVQAAFLGSAAQRLEVWKWYWVDGRLTGNEYVAKALIAFAKLKGHTDDSAVIVVYTPASEYSQESNSTLTAFSREMGDQVTQALERTRLQR